MYISLGDLFDHRQYSDSPLAYCFDRKTYRICDSSFMEAQETGYYQRYIPLFRIDEEEIQFAYFQYRNDRRIKRDYEKSGLCFLAFIERYGLWDDWRNFYRVTIFEIAKQWCIDNSIKYRGEK